MKVVSDSSPPITLAKIGQLELLSELYQRIVITPQVYYKVVVDGEGLAGSAEIKAANWIDVQQLAKPSDLALARQGSRLGIGELSAIQLSREIQADLLLFDEIKARKLARGQELTVLGCVGVLEDAFSSQLLADLRQAYQQLLTSGVYVDPKILENSLRWLRLPPL